MGEEIRNDSGHIKRKPSDNRVIKSGGQVRYEGNIIDYDSNSGYWILNGKQVGSLSNLCKALGLNKETHQIGFLLESEGYEFYKPFK